MTSFIRFFELIIASIGILNMIALVSVEILYHMKRLKVEREAKLAGTFITTLISCLLTEFAIDVVKLFIV